MLLQAFDDLKCFDAGAATHGLIGSLVFASFKF
jgi:hypothetical protein